MLAAVAERIFDIVCDREHNTYISFELIGSVFWATFSLGRDKKWSGIFHPW